MCGSGSIGKQPVLDVATLPSPSLAFQTDSNNSTSSKSEGKNGTPGQKGTSLSVTLLAILTSISTYTLQWAMV